MILLLTFLLKCAIMGTDRELWELTSVPEKFIFIRRKLKMAKRDYKNTPAPAPVADATPTDPKEGLEEALSELKAHVEKFVETFGEEELKRVLPIFTEEHVNAELALAEKLEAICAEARDLAVKSYTAITPDEEDDKVVRMWAYLDQDGKTQYAKTKAEAQGLSKLADIAYVCPAYVIPLPDGSFKEVTIPLADTGD